jgi:hypothetical protein
VAISEVTSVETIVRILAVKTAVGDRTATGPIVPLAVAPAVVKLAGAYHAVWGVFWGFLGR